MVWLSVWFSFIRWIPLVVNILINCFSLHFTKVCFCILVISFKFASIKWMTVDVNACLFNSFVFVSFSFHFWTEFLYFHHGLSKCKLCDKQVAILIKMLSSNLTSQKNDLHFTLCFHRHSHFFHSLWTALFFVVSDRKKNFS